MSNKFNFTKAALIALSTPAQGRVEYSDQKVVGLVIRVTANGVKTFSVFKRVKGGKPVRETIGRFPDVTIEQARRRAIDIIGQLADGIDIAQQRMVSAGILRFSELFDDYMKRHSKPRKTTWPEDESQYRLYLLKPLGSLRLNEITRAHVARVHSRITQRGHLATADRVHALVSSIFNWAKTVGIWETNPAEGIKKNKVKSRDRFMQSDELPRFFVALGAEPNDMLRDFFLVALFTAARRSQVQEMRWSQLRLEERLWTIPDSKNGDPQRLPLSEPAMDVLLARYKMRGDVQVDFVFPSHGKTGHLVEPKAAWLRVKKRMAGLALISLISDAEKWDGVRLQAQTDQLLKSQRLDGEVAALVALVEKAKVLVPEPLIPDVRIHDLRRTLGSWMAITGSSLIVIGKGLNHRSSSATEIYARLNQDPVRHAMETAAQAIKGTLLPPALPVSKIAT